MTKELRILFVDDSQQDVELQEHELRGGGLVFVSTRVDRKDALVEALRSFKPTLIISDHSMPTMDGMAALQLAKQAVPQVPFIFVSGTIGEERAIESLKNGATDYVLKDRLSGLAIKVQRALREVEDREARRKLEEQFRQAQKMEAIGRLAGGVAHDFNNFLTVIAGYGELVLLKLHLDDPNREMIQEICNAGQKAANVTRQLLAFSRKHVSEPKYLDLNAVVKGIEKMLRRLIGEDIDFVTIAGPDLWKIKADPSYLEQVLVNLVVNARDAMPNGGRLAIETANVDLDQSDVKSQPESRQGPHVRLSVSDTGIGMDSETLSHLFEPFFTTKEPGKGTGLGLSTVHGVVQQSGGHIEVHSEAGQGTTFKIYLPRAEKVSETDRKIRLPLQVSRGTETVLLAEDSDSVRRLCEEILRSAGYKVLSAADGTEAIQISTSQGAEVHLLLTDTIMPGIGGAELALHVGRQRPGIRVLFMSGYTDRGIEDYRLHDLGVAFLHKPFTPERLLEKVREVLDSR